MTVGKSTLRRLFALSALGIAPLVQSCVDEVDTHVAVNEVDGVIAIERFTIPTGRIQFDVTNDGTKVHEFMVIHTDFNADELPTNNDGSYQEDAPGTHVMGELEDIEPGDTHSIALDLDPGNYVAICNIVEVMDGEAHAHYALGMRTSFRVSSQQSDND